MTPLVLYKYAPKPFFLEHGLFRFSQPGALNDRKEAQPLIKLGEYTHDDYAVARAKEGHDIPQDLLEAGMATFPAHRFTSERFPAIFRSIGDTRTTAQRDRDTLNDIVSCWRRFADANYGVFSLTETQSPSLWSYYADNSSGVEITFDARHNFFSSETRRVVYTDFPISISSNGGLIRISGRIFKDELIESSKANYFPHTLLLQKRADWSHEKEWRMIKPLSEHAKQAGRDICNFRVFLFAIPPECILAVTFGYRTSDDVVADTLDTARKSGIWKHTEFQRHKLTEYGDIEVEKLSLE